MYIKGILSVILVWLGMTIIVFGTLYCAYQIHPVAAFLLAGLYFLAAGLSMSYDGK